MLPYTPVPNDFFEYLPQLTDAEVRVLLLIIRQTYGWQVKNKDRKLKDRMTYSFVIRKTGLYRTVLSKTIQSLIDKQLILVTDWSGNALQSPQQRAGKHILYYQFVLPVRSEDITCLHPQTGPVRKSEHNKRNTYQKKLLENKRKLAHMQQELLKAHDNRLRSVHD